MKRVDRKKIIIFRRIGIVVWASFLCSIPATLFFFSMFDPISLVQITAWPIELGTMQAYTIGFFMLWLLTAASAALTALLLNLPQRKMGRDIHRHQIAAIDDANE